MPDSVLALAYDLRAVAERRHGCNIGFEPSAPCYCEFGQLAERAWQLARRIEDDSKEDIRRG